MDEKEAALRATLAEKTPGPAQTGEGGNSMPPTQEDKDTGNAAIEAEKSETNKAGQDTYFLQEKARRMAIDIYSSLPVLYNKSFLALAVEYVRISMGHESKVSAEHAVVIQAAQDPIYLMAAATLCSTGRY